MADIDVLGVENPPRKNTVRHVYLSADDVARLTEDSGQNRLW